MKRLIIATIILLIAAVLVTVGYFKNLNGTSQQATQVLRSIPNDASVILEFNNEKSLYDIFTGNKLFANIIGEDKMAEFAALKKRVLQNPVIEPHLNGENLYVSLHPQKGDNIDFLITMSIPKGFEPQLFDELSKQKKNGLVLNTFNIGEKQGYVIYLNDIKRRFYLIDKNEQTLSGSFSKELIESCAKYDYQKEKQAFVLLSDRQSSNSLANLYINYEALSPLFGQLFVNKNTDLFKNFRQLPAFAALSLNYKTDALMFNGITKIQDNPGDSYLGIFNYQKPVNTHLKDIFPSTTAYSTSFALSDPDKFESDLGDWQSKNDSKDERSSLTRKIKNETGVGLKKEFTKLLGTEFAEVTTRFHERIAIIEVKDGSRMRTLLTNISQMYDDNIGLLNYEKLPQLLLGDAFNAFKKPYFKIFDNYLVLTNSISEMKSYDDSYNNRKFMNKMDGYNKFDILLTERSNISFFIHFKNAQQLFREDMKPEFYDAFVNMVPGWKNFYAAAWQFTSSDKNYYTNFCMRLSNDTTAVTE
ncbi:MAG TPA: hypothetical protein VL442_05435 [Mucilaginibacter sp.]|nr:hypothetical protein [Mucilaginibacter sp.]